MIPNEKQKVYRVAELNRHIRSLLETNVGQIWLEGECSTLRRPASGHLYFTLKDEFAQIKAVMFKPAVKQANVAIQEGTKLRVLGNVTVYEAGGDYQINVKQVEDIGLGALQQAFEKLKKTLAAEGLFDSDRKKPLPLLPRHIGVVTSATGAAVRDIINVLTRRFPNIRITVAPVKVQGVGAARQIAYAIDTFNDRFPVDVMIVGRGGGSLEDLWAFNEEVVARSIASSRIPVISAVGHEIDFTIADFVADVRAPTPSAAAELVIEPQEQIAFKIHHLNEQLNKSILRSLSEYQQRVDRCANSYVFREPETLLQHHRQQMKQWKRTMEQGIKRKTQEARQQLLEHRRNSRLSLEQHCLQKKHALAQAQIALKGLNPRSVLDRGFSITRDEKGNVLQSPDQVLPGTLISTLLKEGTLTSITQKETPYEQ